MRIGKSSNIDNTQAASRNILPVVSVSDSAPILGSIATDSSSKSPYFANGSKWISLNNSQDPLVGMYNTNYPVANQDGIVLFSDPNIAINSDTALIGKPAGPPFPDLLGLPLLGFWRKTGDLTYFAQFITIITDKATGTPLSRFKEKWTITLSADGTTFAANQHSDIYAVSDLSMSTILTSLDTPVNGAKIIF